MKPPTETSAQTVPGRKLAAGESVAQQFLDSVELKRSLTFWVNGRRVDLPEADPEQSLYDFLRAEGLTGVKRPCGEGGCGGCSVVVSHWDEERRGVRHMSVNTCLLPLPFVDMMAVTTVEGIGNSHDGVHPVQSAIAGGHGTQCGYCTPGFVVNAFTEFVENPAPSDLDIEDALAGNLCRCTGYRPIVDSLKPLAKEVRGKCGGCKGGKAHEHKHGPAFELKVPDEVRSGPPPPAALLLVGNGKTWLRPSTLEQLLAVKAAPPVPTETDVDGRELAALSRPRLVAGHTCNVTAKIVSGGTDIGYEAQYHRDWHHQFLVSTAKVPEMTRIETTSDGLVVGCSVSVARMDRAMGRLIDELPSEQTTGFRAFRRVIRRFGNRNVRNVGTIGGSLVTADPLSDLYPLFLAQQCVVEIRRHGGEPRSMPVSDFVTGENATALADDEVAVSLLIPFTTAQQYVQVYKVARRNEDAQSLVCAAFDVSFSARAPDATVTRAMFALGAVSDRTAITPNAAAKLVGRSWTFETFEEIAALMTAEYTPSRKFAHPEYRAEAARGSLYKFFIEAAEWLGVAIEPSIASAPSILTVAPTEPKTSQQSWEESAEQTPVGKAMAHSSAEAHCTGEAKFIGDMPFPADGLHAAPVSSKRAHAEVLAIDASEALAVDGVVAFYGAKDVPGENVIGSIPPYDEPVFADGKVEVFGQWLGVVVAETHAAALTGARLVKVTYGKEFEIVQEISEARRAGTFYSNGKADDMVLRKGDPDAAFGTCEHVVDGKVGSGHQSHWYFETNTAVAMPDGTDEMIVHAASQNASLMHNAVARVLGKQHHEVSVRCMRIGGGFGGKQDRPQFTAAATAIAAHRARRPVRMVLERPTDMSIVGLRHAFETEYKVGFDSDGTIKALKAHLFSNAGWSTDLSNLVMMRALYSCDSAYNMKNVEVEGTVCRTNRISCTAMRGFGVPQSITFVETVIDHVARVTGLTPEEVREKNMYRQGDCTLTGYELTPEELSIRRLWERVKADFGWAERQREVEEFNRANAFKKRGLAMSCAKSTVGLEASFMNQSAALVIIYAADASVVVSHGGNEMGQNLHGKIRQIVAGELGVPIERVRVGATDTAKVPNTSPTAGSSGTDFNGFAVVDACRKLNERLDRVRAKMPEGYTWEQLVWKAYEAKEALSATGIYGAPFYEHHMGHDGGREALYLGWTVGAATVEIDLLSGENRVLRMDVMHDAGRAINPATDLGQVEGGVVQGLGYWTTEELVWARDGHLRSRNLSTLKLPTYADIPEDFRVSLLKESDNPRGVLSSKACGEAGLRIGNVVFCALRDALQRSWADVDPEHAPAFVAMDAPASVARVFQHAPLRYVDWVAEKKE